LRAAALWWLSENPDQRGRELRFDVVSVLVPRKGAPEAEHLRKAF
jgi:Holliday junction resolvase-like predicted endonuclease